MGHFDFLRHAAQSDVGRKRRNNEDDFGAFPQIGLWLVADGMGGGEDGEVASAQVVKEFSALATAHPFPDAAAYPSEALMPHVVATVGAASSWVYDYAKRRNLSSCGSTVVGCVLDRVNPGKAVAFHVGDSRLYLLSGAEIRRVTRDHSAAEAIGIKDEAKLNPIFRSMIMRAVGVRKEVEVELTPFEVKPGDRILVCSDGLTRMVSDQDILRIANGQRDPELAVTALVDAANEAGGIDNVTVLIVDVGELPPGMTAAALEPPHPDSSKTDSVGGMAVPDEGKTMKSGFDGAGTNLALPGELCRGATIGGTVSLDAVSALELQKRRLMRYFALVGVLVVLLVAALAFRFFALSRRRQEASADELRPTVAFAIDEGNKTKGEHAAVRPAEWPTARQKGEQ